MKGQLPMLQPIAIYIRRNTINGKGYVGQSVDPLHRWHHESYEKAVIGHALRKYGVECFDSQILFWVETQDAANFWECYLIELYGTLSPNGYNIKDGGSHGNPFAGKSAVEMEVVSAKMSKAHEGEKNHFYGRKHSPENLAKNSAANQGRKNPMWGRKHSLETLAKMSEAHRGRKPSLETCAKISVAHTGRKHSPESCAKNSVARQGEKNPNRLSNRQRRAGVEQLELFERKGK